MSQKGAAWEREVCKQLSLWWTYEERDDIFWRTSGSGARATTRSKRNLDTFGQYGDVQATDPVGQRFMDVCSIELKRGYSKSTFAELIDKADNAKSHLYEQFILQAETESLASGAASWMLIVKRDRKRPIVIMPMSFTKGLHNVRCPIKRVCPTATLNLEIGCRVFRKFFILRFDHFLQHVNPNHIKKLRKGDWYSSAMSERRKTKRNTTKTLIDTSSCIKEDQVNKCLVCDSYAVTWDGDDCV